MKNMYFVCIIFFSCLGLACSTAQVHRAAYVPLPQPSLRSGAPSEGRNMLTFGSMLLAGQQPVEDVTSVQANTETISVTAGSANWVPRSQMNLNFRHRFTKNFDMGISGEWGVANGKQKTYKDDLNLTPEGNVLGIGISFGYNIRINHEWALALGGEYLSFNIPYVRQMTEVDMVTRIGEEEHGTETVGVFSFSIIPRFEMGGTTLFGGVTFRNHPTTPKLEIYASELHFVNDDNVDGGPVYTIISFGAEFRLSHALRLLVMAFQPLNSTPVKYYPMFGVGVSWDMDAPAPHAAAPEHHDPHYDGSQPPTI